jgi:hypothetical protein
MAASRYYVQDDAGVTGTSGGTGQPLSPIFTAQTVADATTVASMFALLFQRSVRLVAVGGTPPYTPLITPSTSCLSMISTVPSGISF